MPEMLVEMEQVRFWIFIKKVNRILSFITEALGVRGKEEGERRGAFLIALFASTQDKLK